MRCVAAAATDDYRTRDPKDVRVLVVGCTGYIGKFVTRELVSRGYNVVAFTREQAGIKGKLGKEDIVKVRVGACCGQQNACMPAPLLTQQLF
jgi:divinyl chlorophyllide a 8-vinyl-reductase